MIMWSPAMRKTTTQKIEDCPYYFYGPRHLALIVSLIVILIISDQASAQQPAIWGQHCLQNDIQKHTTNQTYWKSLSSTFDLPPFDKESRVFFTFWRQRIPHKAYVTGVCRSDITTDVCRRCLADSSIFLTQACPVQMEATARNDECLLHFSNHSFIGQRTTHTKFLFGDKFSGEIKTALDRLSNKITSRDVVRKTAAGNCRDPKLPRACKKVPGSQDWSMIDCITYLAEKSTCCNKREPHQPDFIARKGRKNITFAAVATFASVSLILYVGVYSRVKKRSNSFETEDLQRTTPLTEKSPEEAHMLMSLPRRKWNAVRLLRTLYNKVGRPLSGDMYVPRPSGAELLAQRQLEQEARTKAEEELKTKAAAIAKGKRVASDLVSSISSDETSSKNKIIEETTPFSQESVHHRDDIVTETLFHTFDRFHAKGTDLIDILQELKDKDVVISRVTEESAELDAQLQNANRVIDNLTQKLIDAQSRIEAFEASDAQKTRELKSFASKEAESRVLIARKDGVIKENGNRLQEIIALVISNSSANDLSTREVPAEILSLKNRGQNKSAHGDRDGEAVILTAFEVVPEEEAI